jgi:prepilin-type N-terminal cleavage/methylation domain-containing protein/prepilin-type processing-associated H-X9-DG protein
MKIMGVDRFSRAAPRASSGGGFTLIEVLVTVGVLALLIALLIPSLSAARDSARKAACLSNLHQISLAIHAYANDNRNRIPFGPSAPPSLTPANFYPVTGSPTSLISLLNGKPVGLGLLLRKHLTKEPRALFCPGSDQPANADAELARVGHRQAQCSYYYRHGSATQAYDASDPAGESAWHIRLDSLGRNRDGRPIRALAIDTQFPAPADFAAFDVFSRTHHSRKSAGVLFSDGHAASRLNINERFTVNLETYAALKNAFDVILSVLERADTLP